MRLKESTPVEDQATAEGADTAQDNETKKKYKFGDGVKFIARKIEEKKEEKKK